MMNIIPVCNFLLFLCRVLQENRANPSRTAICCHHRNHYPTRDQGDVRRTVNAGKFTAWTTRICGARSANGRRPAVDLTSKPIRCPNQIHTSQVLPFISMSNSFHRMQYSFPHLVAIFETTTTAPNRSISDTFTPFTWSFGYVFFTL